MAVTDRPEMKPDPALADVTIHGPHTRLRGVRAAHTIDRPWLAPFPVCPALDQLHLAHVGLMRTSAPYRIVRTDQSTSYFLACSRGEGRVLIGGRWQRCGEGTACLLPAHGLTRFEAVPGVRWEFCWACYLLPDGQRPLTGASTPVLSGYDPVPLASAIEGLIHECTGGAEPRLMVRWVDLIHDYVLRFAQPPRADERLPRLWARVANDLKAEWTLPQLAREAGYSKEHLRRLCLSEMGRSPMHQVMHLRMQRAAALLTATREKVETVAEAVGYSSPFVFSKAFRKWTGWQPSEYRRRARVVGTGVAILLSAWMTLGTALADADDPAPRAHGRGEPRGAAPSTVESDPLDRALREEQRRVETELLAEFPRCDDAVAVAGLICDEQGDSTSAIRWWTEARSLPPDPVQVYPRADVCYQLGYAWLLREQYPKAIEALRESVRLNPRRAETHFRLAHACYLSGDLEECLRTLDAAQLESPLAERLRGQVYQQKEQWPEAKRSFEAAVRRHPEFAEAYYGLATACERLGETALAETNRARFNALKAAGQAQGRQARTDFNPLAITRSSVARTHTEAGRVYHALGRPDQAEALWRRAAEIDPANTGCRFQLILLCQQRQQNAEALRFAREMVQAEPGNGLHYLSLGNLHARLRESAEAEAAFRKVIELAPNRSEGYFALAQFLLQRRIQPAEALRLAQQAVERSPQPEHYYVLSQACALAGNLEGARSAIDTACQLDPGNREFVQWRSGLPSPRSQP